MVNNGLMVVSPDGETLALADVASRIPALPVDAKVALWRELVNSGVLRSIESELKAGIIAHLKSVKGTVLPVDGGQVELTEDKEYDYDLTVIKKICPEAIYTETITKVRRAELKKKSKLGETIRAQIESATTAISGNPHLKWKGGLTARVEVEDA